MKYKYWKQGMTVPKSLPKGCQYFSNGTWHDEYVEPHQWEITDRRWPTGKKSARRPSKHERLLKAILVSDRLVGQIHAEIGEAITQRQFDEMSSIKEAMEKKARKV